MNFTLRPWTISDLDNLVKYAGNPKIAKNMTDMFPHPYTIEKGKAFIENATKDEPIHIFAIDIDGQAIGAIGIHPQTDIHRKNAELGYWLAEPFWGQGIITKVIVQIVEIALKTFDIDRIFARPFGTNIASQKALQKAGFVFEGKFEKTIFKNGEYLDELFFAVRRK
jgi:ribosomal-protein-alanine N-acetyltransferase